MADLLQEIWVGTNTHIDPANNVYPAYASQDAAFEDITGLQSMNKTIAYHAPLHFQPGGIVTFVARGSNAYHTFNIDQLSYCCWSQNFDGNPKKYFAFITSAIFTGYDEHSLPLVKITAERDYFTEFVSGRSLGKGYITRTHVDVDGWGKYIDNEPMCQGGKIITKSKKIYGYEDLVPVLTCYAAPYHKEVNKDDWTIPYSLQGNFNSEPARGPVWSSVILETTKSFNKSNIRDGATKLISDFAKGNFDLTKFFSTITMVPYQLLQEDTSVTRRYVWAHNGDRNHYSDYQIVRVKGISQTKETVSFSTNTFYKTHYCNGNNLHIVSYGVNLSTQPTALCKKYNDISTTEGNFKIISWVTCGERPVMRAYIVPSWETDEQPVQTMDTGIATTVVLPTLSLISDSFQDWWLANKATLNATRWQESSSAIASVGQILVGAGVIGGTGGTAAPIGAAMIANGVGGLISGRIAEWSGEQQFQMKKDAAISNSISVSNDYTDSAAEVRGSLLATSLDYYQSEDRTAMDDYFKRYGYTINRMYAPSKEVFKYWTFIEGDININFGNAQPPIEGRIAIRNIFRNGMYFWRANQLGSFGIFTNNNTRS